MPMTPFGKWTPSIIDYEAVENVSDVDNMYPCVRGYAPWNSYHTARPDAVMTANNAICIYGSASPQLAMVAAGEQILAANVQTSTSLWFTLNAVTFVPSSIFTNSGGSANAGTWTVLHDANAFTNHGAQTTTANFVRDVYFSRTVVSASIATFFQVDPYFNSDSKGWSLAQFRGYLLAANRNDFPCAAPALTLTDDRRRVIDLNSSFKAGVIGVINEFVVCGDLIELDSETRNKIWWSAIGCPFDWEVDSATQCGNATLPGGSGEIRGIVSGEYGLILCANEIYRMLYVGLPSIFDITIGFRNMGVIGKHAWASYRDMLFLATSNGFKMILDGSVVHDIGKEDGIDDFFQQDIDTDHLDTIHCAVDGQSTRVFWSYRSGRAGATNHDRMICFDWRLQKWSKRTSTGAGFIPNIVYGDILRSGEGKIGVIDNASGTFWVETATANNPQENYYIETGEYEYNVGGRVLVKGLRPVYEQITATPSVAVYHRESMGQVASSTAAGSANAYGQFPAHVSARYVKFRINFGNKNFKRVAGFQVAVSNEGEQ